VQHDATHGSGFLFELDSTGDVTWFVNLHGWEGYELVEQTATAGVFTVRDTVDNVIRTIDTTNIGNGLDQRGDVYRIYGSPQDYGLPSHSPGGEGEATNGAQTEQAVEEQASPATVEDQTVETVAAAGDASDYANAVDYLFGGVGG
jgi:hypothetical protein